MRRLAFASCVLAAMGVAFANGPVAVETVFSEGTLPAGWSICESGLLSPTYSNYVSHISLAYGGERSGVYGTLAIFATDYTTQTESKIADLNTFTSAVQLDFPAGTDFRSFRFVTNGVALVSWTAVWMDTRLSAPTNIAIANNTASSFDISWDPIGDAITYKISVWTNATVGASAGVATWQETFSGMGSSKTAPLNQDRLGLADHGSDWRDTPFENGYLIDNGGGIRLGTSTATGWISVPHVVATGENALRVTAARYSQDKGQQLAVLCVLDGGATTNLVGTFPVEFEGTYPTFDSSNAVDVIELPASTVGGTLILQTTSGSDGKEARIAVKGIEFVSGYAAGTLVPDVIREETISAADTAFTISDLPSVAVQVSVQALAANVADSSAASETVVVDLAHPPPTPQLVVSGARVADVGGYFEPFDILANLASMLWTDGVSVRYWQARRGASSEGNITEKSGMSNQSAGVYSYHGTNKNDTASYSLAIVSKTNNRMTIGFAVTNDTDALLTNFQLSFTARQWTFTSNRTVPQSLHFECLVTNKVVAVSDVGDWDEVNALKFDAVASLQEAEASGRVDYATGSAFANLTATLTGKRLHPGEVLMLRWTSDPVANGEALGVDDVALTCERHSEGMRVRIVKAGQGGF